MFAVALGLCFSGYIKAAANYNDTACKNTPPPCGAGEIPAISQESTSIPPQCKYECRNANEKFNIQSGKRYIPYERQDYIVNGVAENNNQSGFAVNNMVNKNLVFGS